MTPLLAGALVFVTSGAVLVLEILALRLLAPYVGLSLETTTAVIGTMLGGIAAGTWAGGWAADRIDPRRMLGPLLVFGGALTLLSIPLLRLVGGESGLSLALAAFLAPSAVLSAVSPTVVKLQLRDLSVTGRVVGRLSALGTAGAITGTFLAGYVLIEAAPTTTTVRVLGALCMAGGTAVWLALGLARGRAQTVAGVVVLALFAGGTSLATAERCQTETVYHCVNIVPDPARPGGRTLVLDNLRHSYVDLDDPTYLEFRYAKLFADVIGAAAPAGPLDVLHVGGGGFSLPRYLEAVRPGGSNRVLEIDPRLVDVARDRLGLRIGGGLTVDVGDGRLLIEDVVPASQHVVLGDAFGGLAVPWHLTTVEFVRLVATTLRDGGVYVLNVIDLPPLRFAKAEVATLRAVFDHVAVIAPATYLNGAQGGNYVLVGSDAPIDAAALAARIAGRGGEERVAVDAEAATFAGGAPVLTDDHAPVDQWLAESRD